MGAVVEPALQGAAVDQRGVVGEDQLARQAVVVGQQVHRHEAELRIHEQRQLHRLHIHVLAQRQRRRHIGQGLVHLFAQSLQAGLGVGELVFDPQHPPVRIRVILLGTALHLVHRADEAVEADDAGASFGRRTTMPDAGGVMGVQRQRHRAAQRPEIQLQGFIGHG
ncbi:hypothetical protein D3C81_1335110 [compost metagenome]